MVKRRFGSEVTWREWKRGGCRVTFVLTLRKLYCFLKKTHVWYVMILMTLVACWLFVCCWLLVVTCYLMNCFAINTKKLVASILAMESTRVCKLCEGRMHRICLCTSSGTWWKSAWQLGVWNWPCVGPWSLASYCSIYFVINIFSTNRLRSQFPLRLKT